MARGLHLLKEWPPGSGFTLCERKDGGVNRPGACLERFPLSPDADQGATPSPAPPSVSPTGCGQTEGRAGEEMARGLHLVKEWSPGCFECFSLCRLHF